jgi:hypothetical protein
MDTSDENEIQGENKMGKRHELGAAARRVFGVGQTCSHCRLRASGGHETHVDPARHVVRMVEVAPDVTLEVLDYGGTGVPVLSWQDSSSPATCSTTSRRD